MKKTKRSFAGAMFSKLVCLLFILLPSYSLMAQTISGTVLDEKGTKLSNVSVSVKGTNTGTSSDGNGKFSVAANTGATLVFTYVGYQPVEVKVTNTASELIVSMKNTTEGQGLNRIGY
jgi:hypothetical protein